MTMVMKGRLMLKTDGTYITGGVQLVDGHRDLRIYWTKDQGVEIQFIHSVTGEVQSGKYTDEEMDLMASTLAEPMPGMKSLWEEFKKRIGQFESGNPPIYPTSE